MHRSHGARGVALGAFVVLASACGQASPAPTGPGGPASSTLVTPVATAAAPSPSATRTAAPAVTKRFTFGADAVIDTKLAGTNDLYINPGALIDVGGMLHLFPNSFSTWPGRMKIPHLTSADRGVTWNLDTKADVLDSETSKRFPMADPGIDISTGFVTDDGTWVLLFENVSSVDPWKIYRMTAASPQGPWTVDPKPVIDVGSGADFDAGGAQWPSVVRLGDRWAAYYAGISGPGRGKGQMGVAFSTDGVTWTKQPGPLLSATEAWELHSL